jgi:hypothetical protein
MSVQEVIKSVKQEVKDSHRKPLPESIQSLNLSPKHAEMVRKYS